MFVISEAWLIEHQSKTGSIGREISDDAKAQFERALRAKQAPNQIRAASTLDLFKQSTRTNPDSPT